MHVLIDKKTFGQPYPESQFVFDQSHRTLLELMEETRSTPSLALYAIKEAQYLFINFAYYLGALPAYMDKKTGIVHHVKSKLKLTAYFIVQMVELVQAFLIVGALVNDGFNGRINMRTPHDIMHIEYAATFILTEFLNLHTIRKSHELVVLINSANSYFGKFEETYGTSGGPRDRNFYGKVLKWFFWGCTAIQFGGVVLYLSTCQLSYYSRFLPVCNGNVVSIVSNTTGLLGLYSILQLFGVTYMVSSTYVYITFALPALFMGLEMQTALKRTEIGSFFNAHTNWVRHYQCIQIFLAHVNGCVKAVLMPVHISGIITLIVMLNYIIIRFDLGPTNQATLILVDCAFSMFLLIEFEKGGAIGKITDEALSQRKALQNQSKFDRMELRSLRKFRISIGSTGGCLDDERKLVAYKAILDYTVDMLLTFG